MSKTEEVHHHHLRHQTTVANMQPPWFVCLVQRPHKSLANHLNPQPPPRSGNTPKTSPRSTQTHRDADSLASAFLQLRAPNVQLYHRLGGRTRLRCRGHCWLGTLLTSSPYFCS